MLNKKIIDKEFMLSGSEQNPELTRKDLIGYLASRLLNSTPPPVKAFMDRGEDFVVAGSLPDLVAGMNRLTGTNLIRLDELRAQIVMRDQQVDNPFSKDNQVMGIRNSLAYSGDSLARTAPLHKILDSSAGPLIAIRMGILTRKTLGGLQTDLSGRVLGANGQPVPGLYARPARWRASAAVACAGRHVPRRLPVLRPGSRPRRRPGDRLTDWVHPPVIQSVDGPTVRWSGEVSRQFRR